MPAEHKVSVGWQIVALFVPIANLWAFYRIRKLQRYLLFVFVPSMVLSSVMVAYYFSKLPQFTTTADDGIAFGGPIYDPFDFVFFDSTIHVVTTAISWALFGLSIYLVIIWSRQHNRKFDSPTPPDIS